MSANDFGYGALMSAIESTQFKPGDTGYLLSAEWVKQLSQSAIDHLPPGEIDNKSLRNKRALKPNLEEKKDYFVVPEANYNALVSEFTARERPITCDFDVFGAPNLYPTTVRFKFNGEVKEYCVSKMTLFENLVSIVAGEFGLEKYSVHSLDGKVVSFNSKSRVDAVGGADSVFVFREFVTPPPPEPKVPQKAAPKPKPKPKVEVPQGPPGSEFIRKRDAGAKMGGLENLGNSCYINATIQGFLSLPTFPDRIVGLDGRLVRAVLNLADSLARQRKVNPESFRKVVSGLMPKFANYSQQDAPEFAGEFIDCLHEEQKAVIEELFFLRLSVTTICDRCQKRVVKIESLTTLPVSIVGTRRILFSPWDFDAPLEVKPTPGTVTVSAVFLGLTANGYEPFALTGDYSEVYAFGMPDCFDEETDQGLAVVTLTSNGRRLCEPIVMRAPLNIPADVKLCVLNRIESMIDPAHLRDVRREVTVVSGPDRFTTFPGSRGCREPVVIDIPQGSSVLRRRERLAQGPITLIELVNAFFLRSQLDEKNPWKCEGCHENGCPYREAQLARAPPNLIVQLKRFAGGNRVSRIDTPVVIGEKIDLSHLWTGGSAEYEVRAIVHHRGTLSSGHYTAACRRGHCWYAFNDTTVDEKKGPSVGPSESAYMIFCSKIDT
jgi:hypothetical protein